jgi:hypothetical protein
MSLNFYNNKNKKKTKVIEEDEELRKEVDKRLPA